MGSDGATADPNRYPPGTWRRDEAIEVWLAQQYPACKKCGKPGLALNHEGFCDPCWWRKRK
jgi:hypothetical protein